ncbi:MULTISPECIES: RHS repeat-associated core domain-containing protein [unclassified Pasteurella]|uniref:RHS repeat-associated core domain-containing protein n=1 Tax=unclassified Pasteurella TaxID=2621516 RepID=UPI001FD86DB1
MERKNALNHRFRYDYDKARRLVRLTNENQATYQFQYDAMNRLIAEVGFDNRKTTYHYNKLGALIEKQELSPSNPTQVLRFTEFEHDELGRQVSQRVRTSGEMSQTHYQYDGLNRLTQLTDGQNTLSFSYDKVGRLTEQRQWQMNDSGFANSQVIGYQYDKNGNRLKTLLPNQSAINYHYYGSGHLSAIKYNDQLITEFSRDKLHREISRTQGNLTSLFNRDPVGRLTQQLATLESASKSAVTSGEIIRRNYQYDRVGNLTESEDLRTGKTPYRYDKLGQIQLAGQERFAFDPAHNLIEKETQRIENNQLTEYQGNHYRYDEFGNLSERRLANGEIQMYRYNVKDQLIKAIIQKPNQMKEEWQYQYDVLGRRTSKVRLENGKILADSQIEFIWDGSHLVQEIEHKTDRTFSYIYSHPNSYEPLAQLEFAKDNEKPTGCYYYHNDQIGIPRELTDEEGKVCWYGSYAGWGKLKAQTKFRDDIHQPFRLQNQYEDQETGLHYNFFRYYEPDVGRFTQLDPIGLAGGSHLYLFSYNAVNYIDPLGLTSNPFGFTHEQLNNLAVKAHGDYLAQQAEANIFPKIKDSVKNKPYTLANEVSGAAVAGAGLDFTGGLATSRDKDGKISKCSYVTMCGSVGIDGGAQVSNRIAYTNASTSTGLSFPSCIDVSGSAAGGVGGSMCVNSRYLGGDGSVITSFGPAVGAKLGVSLKQCVQATICK